MFDQLTSVLTYIRDFITLNELVNLYQQLVNQYQEAINEPNNEEKIKVFQETKQRIIDTHNLVNYSSWSTTKLKILERIGAEMLIGPSAINMLNNFFSEFAGTKTVEGLNDFKSQTEQLLNKVNQTITNLSLSEQNILESSTEGLIEITFADAAYQNFWKLGKRSENWQYIFNLFSRVTREDFEEVKIISVASGSDLSTLWIGGKHIIEMLIKASKAVAKLKELKDIFFKDKSELINKFGLKKETIAIVVGERKIRFEKEYEEQKSLFSLNIVREFRGDNKDDGENENELAVAVGLGIEKMVIESEVGVRVLDPKEIKPAETLADDSLGNAYKEEARLATEVAQVIEEEQKEKALKQDMTMKKELASQIEKLNMPSLEELEAKEAEKSQKKLPLENEPKDEVEKIPDLEKA